MAKEENSPKLAVAAYRLATAFYLSDNFDVAQGYFQEALKLSDLNGDSALFARVLVCYGLVRVRLKKYNEGLHNLHQGLRIAEAIEDHSLLIYGHEFLGISAYFQEDYELALKEYQTALVLANEQKLFKEISHLRNNIAQVYAELDQYDSAIVHQKKSIDVQQALEHKRHLNEYHTNHSYLHIQFGEMRNLIQSSINHFKDLEESGMLLDKAAIEPQVYIHEELLLLHDDLLQKQQEERQELEQEVRQWQYSALAVVVLLLVLAGLLWSFAMKSRTLSASVEALKEQVADAESTQAQEALAAALNKYNASMATVLALDKHKPFAVCLQLLSRGMSDSEIGAYIGKERTTVTKYMGIIADALGMTPTELREEYPKLGAVIWHTHRS